MLTLDRRPRRWPGGLRAALCMGAPVLVGVMTGDIEAGLIATLGGFTALYGDGRPYRNRAGLLAVVAVSLSGAVALGTWAATITLVGVCTVAVIAATATLICNALAVGPPGAYQFALVCAVGFGLHAQHNRPAAAALLVLGGGAFAWLVHLSGALLRPRGPETAAVKATGLSVALYLEARGSDGEDGACERAAQDLHLAWTTLIDQQPRRRPPHTTTSQLQEAARQLQVLFDDSRTDHSSAGLGPEPAARARALAADPLVAFDPKVVAGRGQLPLRRPGALKLLRQALQPHSPSRLVVLRVGVSTLLAGALGSLLGFQHPYWAMSAAVLVLHQGFDRRRTIQLGLERVIGTCLGLGLAAIIIAAQFHPLWLVAVFFALNFVVEVVITRNYSLAVVFITAIALLIATGGTRPADLGAVLLARGLDTAVGCAVAVLAFLVSQPGRVRRLAPHRNS